jgi:hypothetical protein
VRKRITLATWMAANRDSIENCMRGVKAEWKRAQGVQPYCFRHLGSIASGGGIGLRALKKQGRINMAKMRDEHEGHHYQWNVVVTPPHVDAKMLAVVLLLQGL